MSRRHWTAVLVFLALALILTNPLALHLWNAVEDKQDALLNTWIMAWVGHSAVTDPLNLYNANIFYPYLNTLAFSEILVPQGLLALPVTLATDNPILSYNLVLIGMFWLNAFAMYLLVLDWTGSRRGGWVAGAIFAFNPFNLSNLAQIQLVSLGWMPLALLFLSRMLRVPHGYARPRLATQESILFALFFILQTLSAIYYGLFTGMLVFIYVLWWAWTQRALFLQLASRIMPYVTRLAFSILLIAVVLIPFLLPYFSVQRELGLQRSVQESEPFSASLQQFAQVAPENILYGKWLSPNPVHYAGGYSLDALFPGLVALILAGVGLVRAVRAPERWFALALLVVAFVLALGPRLYFSFDQATNVTLPYRWLFDLFLPLRALRAPDRFQALIMFALAILAGFAGRALVLDQRALSLSLGAVVLVALEYANVPAANITRVPVASEIPPVYKWLGHQPPGVVLELPMMGPDVQDPRHADISNQYFSTYYWHPTPDGFSGFFAPGRKEIGMEMESFPSPRAISLMQALDVRYLILHWDQISQPIEFSALDNLAGLKRVQEFDDASAFLVAPSLSNAALLSKQLYLPQPAPVGGPYMAFLIISNPTGWPFSIKPTESLNLIATWSDGRVEQIQVKLPLVTSAASVVPITLQAPARAGKYSLKVETRQSAWGDFELRGELEVGLDPARETVIPARVQIATPLGPVYAPGATVHVQVVWEAFERLNAYYSASIRLVDGQGNKIKNVDREPRGRTFLWKPDQPIKDEFDLNLPADLAPGQYRIDLMMYQAETDTTVLLLDQDSKPREIVTLGEFRVK